jgi:hypothetical protein
MSITRDMARSWRAHRAVVRGHLARGRSEPFVFTFLFVFLILTFVAQYPRAARIALENPEIPLAAQLLGLAYGLLLFLPLAYALAALSHLIARGLGARGGSWYGARLALFWSLVACTPLVLLQGLTFGIIGAGAQALLVGVLALTAFAVFWALALVEVYSQGGPNAV